MGSETTFLLGHLVLYLVQTKVSTRRGRGVGRGKGWLLPISAHPPGAPAMTPSSEAKVATL